MLEGTSTFPVASDIKKPTFTLPETFSNHRVHSIKDQLVYLTSGKENLLIVYDTLSKKVLYKNDILEASTDFYIPGTHYYLSGSGDVVNAAGPIIGYEPLHGQLGAKNEKSVVSNGIVVHIENLCSLYPSLREWVSKKNS
jgi:hypothetical protein